MERAEFDQLIDLASKAFRANSTNFPAAFNVYCETFNSLLCKYNDEVVRAASPENLFRQAIDSAQGSPRIFQNEIASTINEVFKKNYSLISPPPTE